MQLGKWPQEVPKQWVAGPELFRSEYDIGRFPEVAGAVGLGFMDHAGGVAMEDFDGDGLLDLMISSSGPLDQLRFFHNNGDGTFTERTKEAGLTGEVGGLNLVAADYDNDGHPDLLVLRGGWWREHGKYPLSLLHNKGDGTFEDVTKQAGLMSLHPTQTAAWADFDNDGWLDLFVGHESTGPDKHPSQLFHNNHDGTFTEVGAANGLADLGFVKGVAWGDFNNDGWPDLYVSRKGQPNLLFRNDGPKDAKHPRADKWKFTDVTAQAGVAEPMHSFATLFFDYDNDGWPDIFVAGYYNDTLERHWRIRVGTAVQGGDATAVSQQSRRDVYGRDQAGGTGPGHPGDGRGLWRPGQRWLAGHLSGHGHVGAGGAAAEPDVSQRWREEVSGRDDVGRVRAFAEGTRRGVRRH